MKHALRPMALRPLRILPPRLFSMLVHLLYQHEYSNFRRPQTFTELIVEKKLNDKNPIYPMTVDKLRVRDFVSERVGRQHLVPLLQAVDSPEQIDFDALPPACVIKARHGYNMNLLIRPNERISREAIIARTTKWMDTNIYYRWKEWAYRECPPGLIIEEFLGDTTQPPADIKFYVFNGRTGMIQVDNDRFVGHKVNLFDRDWNELDFDGSFPPQEPAPDKPANLAKLLEVAETIAADFEFARIDLYNVAGHVYFGEITHYPGAGIVAHKPKAFDIAIGDLWQYGTPLPERFVKRKPSIAA